jgi:transposase
MRNGLGLSPSSSCIEGWAGLSRSICREVLNAIRYMARSGGGWRMLPNDFPPWQTVYWWFRRFARPYMFQTIHDVALMLDRERVGREASPGRARVWYWREVAPPRCPVVGLAV